MDRTLPLRIGDATIFPDLPVFNQHVRRAKGLFLWPSERTTCNPSNILKRKQVDLDQDFDDFLAEENSKHYKTWESVSWSQDEDLLDYTSLYEPYSLPGPVSLTLRATNSDSELFTYTPTEDNTWTRPDYPSPSQETEQQGLPSWWPHHTKSTSNIAALPLFLAEIAFRKAALEHFSPLDIETLVSSPGPEFHCNDHLRGGIRRPFAHAPGPNCACAACLSFGTLIRERHDVSEWCYCADCMFIRDGLTLGWTLARDESGDETVVDVEDEQEVAELVVENDEVSFFDSVERVERWIMSVID